VSGLVLQSRTDVSASVASLLGIDESRQGGPVLAGPGPKESRARRPSTRIVPHRHAQEAGVADLFSDVLQPTPGITASCPGVLV